MDLTTQRFMMGASAGGISYWLADVSFSGFSSTNTGYKLALATDTDDVYINGYTYQTAASRYRGFTLKIDIGRSDPLCG